MATASGKAAKETEATAEDLEIEIARLKEDIAKLAEQLARTGETSVSAAKRAAAEGAEHLRHKGEEAVDSLRANANDIERQVCAAVREKPVTALAVAFGVGYLLAMLRR